MKKILVLVLSVTIQNFLTGCGTIGGALSGAGNDLSAAGSWCSDWELDTRPKKTGIRDWETDKPYVR